MMLIEYKYEVIVTERSWVFYRRIRAMSNTTDPIKFQQNLMELRLSL